MTGVYKEKLPSQKGQIVVSSNSWHIEYYFPGIDLRQNGTFVRIQGEVVDDYIAAYQNNWKEYYKIKLATDNLNAESKTIGEKNMTIYVGGSLDGVCINSYHMPLNTEEKIQSVIDDYYWAQMRATEIIQLLKKLN